MAKAKKPAKKTTPKQTNNRPDKYEDKLKLKGSFEEVMKALITPKTPDKKK
jgi:hypothetical protein